ncbi:phasin family protein [Neobacillus pocheonensis]|uniref:Phasin family protein n=1 Tax=Neobacillus pocheonensis TaxID=363869 RepID=A0ABT0W7G6_9BACI|nr:phasin family protein [Neobacillus pocheonensis]
MSNDYNLFEIWKDFYSQSSNIFDEKVMESFPSEGLGQILDMNLQVKKLMDETTERYLQFVNVPSRNDIANLSSQLVNVDAKVDSLEELLEENKGKQGNQGSFQRELTDLKKDMKSLDNKLNQILSLLKSSEATK